MDILNVKLGLSEQVSKDSSLKGDGFL